MIQGPTKVKGTKNLMFVVKNLEDYKLEESAEAEGSDEKKEEEAAASENNENDEGPGEK